MAKQTEQFHFYATKEEADIIHQRMEEAGVKNKCAYLREMAVNGYIINVELHDVKEMTGLLGRYGNNINQIAKKANETNNITADDVEKLRNEVESLSHILSQYLSTLQSKKV